MIEGVHPDTFTDEELLELQRHGVDPSACTCMQPWFSILPPPPCPVHGQAENWVVTY